MQRTRRRLLIALALGAALGLAAFGILAYRAVSVEQAPPPEALRRFAEVRSGFRGAAALIALDDSGNVIRRGEPPAVTGQPVSRFRVLVYQAAHERLVSADVPFWFFKLKGSAAQYAVRGTGLDLERLHITGAELQRYGPCLVIDHVRSNGDRVLVWTE